MVNQMQPFLPSPIYTLFKQCAALKKKCMKNTIYKYVFQSFLMKKNLMVQSDGTAQIMSLCSRLLLG